MATEKKRGRPRIAIDLDQLRDDAANGLTLVQCALCQGISHTKLMQDKAKDPAIQEAWLEGKAKGTALAAKELRKRGIDGKSDTCLIFFLKNQGWSDRQTQVLEGNEEKPIVVEVSDVRSKVLGRLLPPKPKAE